MSDATAKPFSISEHGYGVYLRRDGEEVLVGCHDTSANTLRWYVPTGSWYDNGRAFANEESPMDLVCYLRPLPSERRPIE